jgi:hypothetical protein
VHIDKLSTPMVAVTRHRVPMQQIADWLEGLGASEYVQRFVENGLNETTQVPDRGDARAWLPS